MSEPKRTYRISPYHFTLLTMENIMYMFITVQFVVEVIKEQLAGTLSIHSDSVVVLMIILGSFFLISLMFIAVAFQTYGKVVIMDDCLEFRALFRKTRRFDFYNIKYIGMAYLMLNGKRQYWIYIRQDEPTEKDRNNLIGSQLNKRNLRIQYKKNVFDALVYYLPRRLSDELISSFDEIQQN